MYALIYKIVFSDAIFQFLRKDIVLFLSELP